MHSNTGRGSEGSGDHKSITNERILAAQGQLDPNEFKLLCATAVPLSINLPLAEIIFRRLFEDGMEPSPLMIGSLMAGEMASPLLEEVGVGLRELNLERTRDEPPNALSVRNQLLSFLTPEEVNRVIDAVLEFSTPGLESLDPDVRTFAQAVYWAALSLRTPKVVSERLYEEMKANLSDPLESQRLARLALSLNLPDPARSLSLEIQRTNLGA